jgi:hypothetical protein
VKAFHVIQRGGSTLTCNVVALTIVVTTFIAKVKNRMHSTINTPSPDHLPLLLGTLLPVTLALPCTTKRPSSEDNVELRTVLDLFATLLKLIYVPVRP